MAKQGRKTREASDERARRLRNQPARTSTNYKITKSDATLRQDKNFWANMEAFFQFCTAQDQEDVPAVQVAKKYQSAETF